ncbi:MAG: proline--tRNA ligase [Armatimonadetes bacterium]|nr:proline--tRNA ligase [Armatimonadota bacterium]
MSGNLGITPRGESYSDWYTDLVLKAELADYSPVRGCMVIRPNGYAIWENMQRALDDMFKATGHTNAYFPLLIPMSFLVKEAEHVEGFAPQCAIVTHYRLKPGPDGKLGVDPDAELEEPLIVRPTSETIIWPMVKKWVQSYRDLPVLLNQWCNVMRWELRTRLFMRTAEFLWQEGHTAHATYEEAEAEQLQMIHIYRRFAEEWMAVPVLTGLKTRNETFPGADHTYCIEAMSQDLRCAQAGTSHHFAQNFGKAYEVQFQTADGQLDFVHTTSWGLSTRMIAVLIMAHSDDKGFVVPPRLAPTQVVFVPMGRDDETRARTYAAADQMAEALTGASWNGQAVRVKVDKRANESPGFKYNDWELKGACLRVEVGPRDLDSGTVVVARRDTGEKATVPSGELVQYVLSALSDIQSSLFRKALALREANTHRIDDWASFEKHFEGEGGSGFVLAHWDGTTETELAISEKTKATIRCIPFEPLHPDDAKPGKCILTGKESKQRVVFAKAY